MHILLNIPGMYITKKNEFKKLNRDGSQST